MLKWILIAAVLYLLYRMIESGRRKKDVKNNQDFQQLVAKGELIKDPICGTYVEKESSISAREGEVVHYFCSYACRDTFLKQHGILPEANDNDTDAQG